MDPLLVPGRIRYFLTENQPLPGAAGAVTTDCHHSDEFPAFYIFIVQVLSELSASGLSSSSLYSHCVAICITSRRVVSCSSLPNSQSPHASTLGANDKLGTVGFGRRP